jgi:hypothetical protein
LELQPIDPTLQVCALQKQEHQGPIVDAASNALQQKRINKPSGPCMIRRNAVV